MKEIKTLLGKRIKEIRTARNMTQEYLAEKIGVEQRNISYIERGLTFPSQYLLKLADALDVSISDLLDFEHHKYSIEEMCGYMIKNLYKISDKDIPVLFRIIKSMT